jgi:hypothetical protein
MELLKFLNLVKKKQVLEVVKNIVLKKGGIKPILVDLFYKKNQKKCQL